MDSITITTKHWPSGMVAIFHNGKAIYEFGSEEVLYALEHKTPLKITTTYTEGGKVSVFINKKFKLSFNSPDVYDTIKENNRLKKKQR